MAPLCRQVHRCLPSRICHPGSVWRCCQQMPYVRCVVRCCSAVQRRAPLHVGLCLGVRMGLLTACGRHGGRARSAIGRGRAERVERASSQVWGKRRILAWAHPVEAARSCLPSGELLADLPKSLQLAGAEIEQGGQLGGTASECLAAGRQEARLLPHGRLTVPFCPPSPLLEHSPAPGQPTSSCPKRGRLASRFRSCQGPYLGLGRVALRVSGCNCRTWRPQRADWVRVWRRTLSTWPVRPA